MKDKPFHGNSSMDRPIPDEFLPIRRYASSSKIIISTAKKEESSTTSDDQPLDEQEGKKSHTGAKKHKAGKKFSKKRLMRLKNWKLQ
jgi:hypothetical protein